ncbi:MAG TPA: hypothetical protein VF195_07885 [Actinomycetota bacterium]
MRRVTLVLISSLMASLAVLAALIVWLGWVLGAAIGLTIAIVVVTLYITVVGPWQRRWGTTDAEARGPMPGDDLLRPGAPSTTRAITIDAAPRDVFPWLVQIGYERGGWYSYDWIDNDGRRSIDRIDPTLQDLSVGDRIQMFPGFGPVVREIVPEHHILSGGDADTWCLLLEPTAEGRTRLVSRWRQDWPKTFGTFAWALISDPGAFVMERKMLRTIRSLAEARRVGGRMGRSTTSPRGSGPP